MTPHAFGVLPTTWPADESVAMLIKSRLLEDRR